MQDFDIIVTEPGETLYNQGLMFARDIFLRKHDAKAPTQPNMLTLATCNKKIIGTMGLMYGKNAPYLFEQCDPGDAFVRLSGNASRTLLAEITRFAINEELTTRPYVSRHVAELLLRQLLTQGKRRNLVYYGFVGKTSFRVLLTPFGISPIKLGIPTFSDMPTGKYTQQKNLFSFGFKLN